MRRLLAALLALALPAAALADTTISGPITFGTGLTVTGATVTAPSGSSGIDQLTSDVTAGPGIGSQAATIANNAVTNAKAAQMGANTMKGNWTSGTANAADNAMPSCSDTGGNHLNYVSGTGVTCGTSAPAVSQRLAIGWPAGIDPTLNVIGTIDQASTVVSIVGTVATAVGAAANVDVYATASGTACASGTKLNNATPFDANGTANTNQTLTLANTAVSAGMRLCLVTDNGSNWTAGVGVGGVTVRLTTP